MLEDLDLHVFSVHFTRQAAPDKCHTQDGQQHAQPFRMNEVGVLQMETSTLQSRVSKLRRKSVSGGLQTWHILKNSGPDALETPLSSLKLG